VESAFAAAGQRLRELAAAQAEAEGKAFAASVQDQASRTQDLNDEIARTIELLRQRRILELELVDAAAARKIAEVDANEDLTEPERIRQRAEIQRESLAKRREAEIAGIRDSTEPAAGAARKQQDIADDLAADLAEDRAKADALRAEVESLKERLKQSERMDDRVKRLEEGIASATESLPDGPGGGYLGIPGRDARARIRAGKTREEALDPSDKRQDLNNEINRIYDMMEELAKLRNDPRRLGPQSPVSIRLEEAQVLLDDMEAKLEEQQTALTEAAKAARKAAEAYEEAASEAKRTEEIRRRIYAEEDRKFDVETGKKTRDARKNAPTYGPELPPGFGEEEDLSPEAKKIRKVADTLSGAGNASGAAKRILLEAVERAEADGTVTLQEMRALGGAIEQAFASLSSVDAEHAAELKAIKERIENMDRITRKKLRK
jgi:hypothetical protein